ncbi:transcriptional repressor LexA [Anaerolineales bacterium]
MSTNKAFSDLSERQKNILRFMKRYIEANGYPPSIREIGNATDINSTSVVNYNIQRLVEAGYLERDDRVSRGLRLVEEIPGMESKIVRPSFQSYRVPMIGTIVASEPVSVPDDTGYYFDEEDVIEVPFSLLNGVDESEVFALKVRGNSMIDAMISEGDIVIMRRQDTARNGDMVAVWLLDRSETTLKRIYHEGAQVRLQPAHPAMDPIFVEASNCQIRGRVLSVLRQLH